MLSFFFPLYRFVRSVWRALDDPQFKALFATVGIILLTGTVFYHFREGWSWLDSLYFSVVTLTTVGYGDLTVQTTAGKIFTMLYLFVGIGVLLAFINAVAERSLADKGSSAAPGTESL